MTKRNKYAVLIMACILSTCIIDTSLAQSKKSPKQKNGVVQSAIMLDNEVKTGKLKNGFTYYIRHNEEPKNRVVFYLANKVGSILEDDDEQGLAHFMEHMNFNGTTNFPHNELVDFLQKAGVRFGADINAYTSFDETVFQLPLPTKDHSLVLKGLEIMHDWAHGALLDPEEINKERGVILEEERLDLGLEVRMKKLYEPMLYNYSRYVYRLPIGKDSVLKNFKPETLKSFYNDWYRPDLQALIIVGDIDVNEMELLVKTGFSDLKNPEHEKPRIKYTTPVSGKSNFMAVTDREMPLTTIQLSVKHPASKIATNEGYRQHLIRQLFNTMMSGRYAKITELGSAPYKGAGTAVDELFEGLDSYTVSVQATAGQLKAAFKTALAISERVNRFGFTETEFQRARQDITYGLNNTIKEDKKINSDGYVNKYLQHFLNNTPAPDEKYKARLLKIMLSGITNNEVTAFARSQAAGANKTIVIKAPEKDKAALPDEKEVYGWINSIKAEKMLPFNDEFKSDSLIVKMPESGSIISEDRDTALDITTLRLNNGLTVLLKQTNYEDNAIYFKGLTPGGTSLYDDKDFMNASMSAGIIGSFGVANLNGRQLNEFLSHKKTFINAYIGDRTQEVVGKTSPDELELGFKLLYASYRMPGKDEVAFDKGITDLKENLISSENSPRSVFNDTVTAVLGNHNFRKTPATLEKIAQIKLEKTFNIYKERFGNLRGSIFAIVGSFDMNAIKPLVAKYIGGLPVVGEIAKPRDLAILIPEGQLKKTVYKGTEQQANVELVWSGNFDYNTRDAYTMDALQEVLEIRLLERLREQESGVYVPTASVTTQKIPRGRFNLRISFGCAPQNVEKLIKSAIDEVNILSISGPAAVNLDKWKAENTEMLESMLKSDRWWLDYLAGQTLDNEDLYEVRSAVKLNNAISVQDIKRVAAKYLDGKNFARFVLLPEGGGDSK